MGYAIEIGYVLAVALFSHGLHRFLGCPSGITRKLTHILIGFVFFIQYHWFSEDTLGLLLGPTLITAGLFLIARLRLVPSLVNPENPYGIFYYALAILVTNVICVLYPPYHAAAGAAILCLAFGDGAAALFTARLPRRHRVFGEKTAEGSLFCFLFSLLGMGLVGWLFPPLALPLPILPILALLTTLLELFGGRYDNPLIVFGVGAAAALLPLLEEELQLRLLAASFLGVALVLLSVRRRMLTLPASLLSLLLLFVILLAGGYPAALYILVLYGLCAIMHAGNRRRKNRHSDSVRGIGQVANNAAAAGLSLLLFAFIGARPLLVAYYASLAEFFSDTAASDIGTRGRREPFDICRFRRIARGTSGGVSLLGTLASLAASLLSALLSLLCGLSYAEGALVFAVGFFGMLLDSVIGSLAQGKYRCPLCGADTEKRVHCGAPAERVGGLAFLDNSRVNLVCTLTSAALAAALSFLLIP